jgi:hypothetical protein
MSKANLTNSKSTTLGAPQQHNQPEEVGNNTSAKEVCKRTSRPIKNYTSKENSLNKRWQYFKQQSLLILCISPGIGEHQQLAKRCTNVLGKNVANCITI